MGQREKAVLMVSFGTTYREARNKSYEVFKKRLEAKYPEYDIYQAFTSGRVLDLLRNRDHIAMQSVEEAMQKIKLEGYREVGILMLFALEGIEYHKALRIIDRQESFFENLRIGKVLLGNQGSINRLVMTLKKELSPTEDEALIFMGHGTSMDTDCQYQMFEKTWNSHLAFRQCFLATVEGRKEVDELLEELSESGYKKVRLIPLMLVAGDHVDNDLMGNTDSWKVKLEKAGYRINCDSVKGLLEYESIQDLFMDQGEIPYTKIS